MLLARPLRLAALLAASLAPASPVVAAAAGPAAQAKAFPPGETPAQRDARMAWWREARFGMFVHWGLYSGLAGTWEGKPVGSTGGMEWIQQRVKADTDTYARAAIPRFRPVAGFAREWAQLAREAGCRYLVFTTKHHEGFALHDSRFGDYDAGDVLGRDLVREIVEAARAEGLKVGFYHSLIDWHDENYDYPAARGLPHPLAGQPSPNGPRNHASYLEHLHGQVGELVSNYGPVDILWWDFSSKDFQGDAAWRATELMRMVRKEQPHIIMNNRLFVAATVKPSDEHKAFTTDRGDFTTPEQHVPASGIPGVDWETCMTLNTTWGFSDHDHAWKADKTLIRHLVDIASKGGNYLLNVGPRGDGSLSPETRKAFQAIGAWMKVNGEAIYGTTASPFAGLGWGRCTRKGRSLYLIVFDWPEDGRLLVPISNRVEEARLLADVSVPLAVSRSEEGTCLQLPETAPDPIATVVRLTVEGEPHVLGAMPGRADGPPAAPDFSAALQPSPATARFESTDHYIWCGSPVEGDDGTWHLFYSRWPRALGHHAWVTHSEVARATGPSPLGPWTHRDVVLPARGARFWDGLCTHNPTIHRFDGKFYLYYMGNTGDGREMTSLNWTHRNNQRIGVAVADSPQGPWRRFDEPLITPTPGFHDALLTSNPSIARRPEGGYLMVYKAVADKKPLPFGGPVLHVAATSKSPTGPFVKAPEPVFAREGVHFAAEDPFIWRGRDRYWAIVKDMGGFFTSAGKSLALFESSDGLVWRPAARPLVSTTRIRLAPDGARRQLFSLERPQLAFDRDGVPIALLCAGDYDEERRIAFNLGIPLGAVDPAFHRPLNAD